MASPHRTDPFSHSTARQPAGSGVRIATAKPGTQGSLAAPLAVPAAWEQKVCSADCTTGLRIALGSFLLAAHTSMRFGDIQRIRVQDISLTQHALRGSCWATKTTKSGQPWACTIFGLTGRDEKSSWVLFWLRSLSISVTHSATSAPDLPSPDFVLPALASITKDTPASFQSPMAYTQGGQSNYRGCPAPPRT